MGKLEEPAIEKGERFLRSKDKREIGKNNTFALYVVNLAKLQGREAEDLGPQGFSVTCFEPVQTKHSKAQLYSHFIKYNPHTVHLVQHESRGVLGGGGGQGCRHSAAICLL